MATAFISYTHGDEALKDRLIAHLAPLRHEGLIEIWHDRMLRPGEHLDPAIQAQLAEAELILLLVSAEFIASRYCYEEDMLRAFRRQREGRAIVVPVILRPCQWKNVPIGNGHKLGDFLALPPDGRAVSSWGDADEALDEVAAGLRRLLLQPSRRDGDARPADPQGDLAADAAPSSLDTPLPRPRRLVVPAAAPTDHDKDRFLRDGFNETASLFQARLNELEATDKRIKTEFERIDSRCFVATAYLDGADIGGVRLFYGGDFMGRAICLGFGTSVERNSMND